MLRTYTSDELAARGLDDGDCPSCGCTDVMEVAVYCLPGKVAIICRCDSCEIKYSLEYVFNQAIVKED